MGVSTHSRPKAAAKNSQGGSFVKAFQHTAARRRLPRCIQCERLKHGFNTQPPEGGCVSWFSLPFQAACFNTQPPEGGCAFNIFSFALIQVSTHSRPKAAAMLSSQYRDERKGFNTQPPEGGCFVLPTSKNLPSCFNTQPPEGGCMGRRRHRRSPHCFNTQPPEGGCFISTPILPKAILFQHTAARRRLQGAKFDDKNEDVFQHTAARRRLLPLAKRLPIQALKPVIRQRCRKRQWGQV